ncbi:hypothetical protein KM043_010444 [Ampulex compressa]|nr:hypothetical protein KM043_010444 [Ampulex compressa]
MKATRIAKSREGRYAGDFPPVKSARRVYRIAGVLTADPAKYLRRRICTAAKGATRGEGAQRKTRDRDEKASSDVHLRRRSSVSLVEFPVSPANPRGRPRAAEGSIGRWAPWFGRYDEAQPAGREPHLPRAYGPFSTAVPPCRASPTDGDVFRALGRRRRTWSTWRKDESLGHLSLASFVIHRGARGKGWRERRRASTLEGHENPP